MKKVLFQMPDHIQNNCPRAVMQCPYYYIGCNAEVCTLYFSMFYTFLKETHIRVSQGKRGGEGGGVSTIPNYPK